MRIDRLNFEYVEKMYILRSFIRVDFFISSFLVARLKKEEEKGSVGRDKKKFVGKIKFSGVDDFQTLVMIFIPPSSTLPTTCVLSACLCFCALLCVCHS